MESVKAKVTYVTYLTVREVKVAITSVHTSGWGKDAVFQDTTLGWDVFWIEQIGGLRFPEPPHFKAGDRIKLSYEKVD